ncbi:MAG: metallophosphoesterase [bacterium]
MSTHLVIPDPHAHPEHNNDRAFWLGRLINDIKPDVVINIGDSADMPSLSAYDRGKKSFQGRTYARDIAAHHDFQDKLWWTVKSTKKRLPHRVALEGNHDERIKRAINLQPELEGAIGPEDLGMDYYYDQYVEYEGLTPGIVQIDGVSYAHYFTSGVKGLPVAGEHPGYYLVSKKFTSCTQGHTHTTDFCVRTDAQGKRILGLVCGVFIDYRATWAGSSNDLWWQGVIIKRHVDNGVYDPEFVSMARLRDVYGSQ